eukprot:jgi/Mesen1/2517/ME000016S01863
MAEGDGGAEAFGQSKVPLPDTRAQVQPNAVGQAFQGVVSLGLLVALDRVLKQSFAAASIRFPSALFGMLCIFSVLVVIDLIRPHAAQGVLDFFAPANTFIQRYLPLFYVPSLVVLPLALQGIAPAAGAKMAVILSVGWMGSLAVTGLSAVAVRGLVKTEMKPAAAVSKPAPPSGTEVRGWALATAASFAAAVALGLSSSVHPAVAALPYLLSATVLGYFWGSRGCCTPSSPSTPSLTAAAVIVTGLLGANFGQALMDRCGFKDPIARGLATACSSHGLGTAALAAKEPEALPFCALAYGLTGIISSLLCTLPVVRQTLIAIAGP